MKNLYWVKLASGGWCPLETVDLADVKTVGVYIIWYSSPHSSRVVRVGQGEIASRLLAHRNDPKILAYKQKGKLLVTWAWVPAAELDNVERYLADQWGPLAGDRYPDAVPIAVNSPWSA